jgi:hypothetical protein
MFVDDTGIVIRKPFYKLKSLKYRYQQDFAKWGNESPFVMHFRIATHGSQSPQNTHPHVVLHGEVAMVHNGILAGDIDYDYQSDKSDTVQFIQTYLIQTSKAWLMSQDTNTYLSQALGMNRIVFMDNEKRLSIINEPCGKWVEDSWYSNDPNFVRTIYHGYPVSACGQPMEAPKGIWIPNGTTNSATAMKITETIKKIDPDLMDEQAWVREREIQEGVRCGFTEEEMRYRIPQAI